MSRLAALLLLLALPACTTTTTEVRYTFCATIDTFPPDVPREAADSVRVDDCTDASLNGTIIRRAP